MRLERGPTVSREQGERAPPPGHGETRAAARRRLAAALAAAGIASADLDARLLVCAVAGIDHAELIGDPDVPLDAGSATRLARLAARRIAGEPVSRILGRKEFWGLVLEVSPAVLDPRPETEGLVASVLDAIGGRRATTVSVLDLGTGSGAILAALLHELPQAIGVGIDRSEAACRIADANLRGLGLSDRAHVVCGDWAAAVRSRFDILVSNPPYIRTADIPGLDREVRAYDPLAALDGGPDGLGAYRAIIPDLRDLLRPGGTAAFECGAGQGRSVTTLMQANGLRDATVYRDLAGHDRVALGSLAP